MPLRRFSNHKMAPCPRAGRRVMPTHGRGWENATVGDCRASLPLAVRSTIDSSFAMSRLMW